MRTVSEKYANSSKYYMGNTDFFSTETITVPISFRLFTIAQLSLLYHKQYPAQWDRGLTHREKSGKKIVDEKVKEINEKLPKSGKVREINEKLPKSGESQGN